MVGVLGSGDVRRLRTAAAGAVAAGGQARYQLLALLKARPIEQVTVRGRRRAGAQYRRDMAAAGVPVIIAATAREAVQHGAGRDVPQGDW